ncbi:MAG: protein phosphatase 2C domain-containing protein [Burkholderiaceae bacterium]|jgi:serine/threonine protein phosphatase PrpC|nr:protein phosphatase 2C domain-containing protein [Burkholderiaceae bacterium]
MHDMAAAPAAGIPLSTSQFSCAGQRAANQDATGYHLDERFGCFVVSDGVGGHAGGERAARIAVDTALNTFTDAPSITADSVQRGVAQANAGILSQQRADAEYARMSATLVALFIDRCSALARWAHVGDSRLYWFRRGVLATCTEDHSLSQRSREGAAAALVGSSEASPANGAQPLIQSNLLYRALGARAIVEPTISDAYPLADGDAFLLCTDGLWRLISPQVMERSLRLSASAEEWLALLRRAAEAKADVEGADNYSALAVWVGAPQQVTLASAALPIARQPT